MPGGWLPCVRHLIRQGSIAVKGTAITDAFLTAARNGDFDALLEALDPDVVVRSNGAEAVRGAAAVAGRAFPFTRIAQGGADLGEAMKGDGSEWAVPFGDQRKGSGRLRLVRDPGLCGEGPPGAGRTGRHRAGGGGGTLAATRAPGHEPHDDEDGQRDQPDDDKRLERGHHPARSRDGKPYSKDRAEDCPDDPAHVPSMPPGPGRR
jgi:hypothetical protein